MEKLFPTVEKAWFTKLISQGTSENWSMMHKYVIENGLHNETQEVAADLWESSQEKQKQIFEKIIYPLSEIKCNLTHPKAISIFLRKGDFIKWLALEGGRLQDAQYEKLILENNFYESQTSGCFGYEAWDAGIRKYVEQVTILDDAVASFLDFAQRPDVHNITVVKINTSIIEKTRPDALIIQHFPLHLLLGYFNKYHDLPDQAFEKLLNDTSGHCEKLWTLIQKTTIELSPRMLKYLLCNCQEDQIMRYLNILYSSGVAINFSLTLEDQEIFFNRKDCDLAIMMYNSVIGFDTEFLKSSGHTEMLESRSKRRKFEDDDKNNYPAFEKKDPTSAEVLRQNYAERLKAERESHKKSGFFSWFKH